MDACALVAVDADDDLAVPDAGDMLDGAADSARHVEAGLHLLAADAHPLVHPAQVRAYRPRTPDLGVKDLRDLLQQPQVLLGLETAARGDYY